MTAKAPLAPHLEQPLTSSFTSRKSLVSRLSTPTRRTVSTFCNSGLLSASSLNRQPTREAMPMLSAGITERPRAWLPCAGLLRSCSSRRPKGRTKAE